MTDITFTKGHTSSREVTVVHKKKLAARTRVQYSNRDQLAIAAVLFVGGIAVAIVLATYLLILEGIFLY